tara:strand:+ start:34291 stop:35097 length:807 start_codon:yes stop_codon:yes gene_type:complete
MIGKSISFLVLLGVLMTLTACGKNPHIIDQLGGEIGGNDPIGTDPTPTPNPGDPLPPPPPQAKLITLAPRDYNPSSGEKVVVELPYRTKKVKHVAYGKSQTGLLCRLFGSDNCVRNRQVLFAFDIPAIGKINRIHDIRLQANFVTYGRSFDTELICLNNIGTCSGNGIRKIPVLGLSKYVKKKWWNSNYWAAGYEDVVRNDYFQQALNASKTVNEHTTVTGIKDFSLKTLFDLGDQDLINLLRQEQSFWFTVADDTFVMSPKLLVIYE